eukprot:6055892-Karenia_brevis.AAC.1
MHKKVAEWAKALIDKDGLMEMKAKHKLVATVSRRNNTIRHLKMTIAELKTKIRQPCAPATKEWMPAFLATKAQPSMGILR